MKKSIATLIVTFSMVLVSACSDRLPTSGSEGSGEVLPMFVDDNGNGINDFVEQSSHDPGSAVTSSVSANGLESGTYGHGFVDSNGDGICDFAQDGSNTWHGPGFTDEDGDGVCDYWQDGSYRFNSHSGLQYRDTDRNRINDTFELRWHEGYGHDFRDTNGDGICDYGQDGGSTWHGPGFEDADNDGTCDHWQPGGNGYGHGRR